MNDYFRAKKKIEADNRNNEDTMGKGQIYHHEIEDKVNVDNLLS
jgi:hypothetical protein